MLFPKQPSTLLQLVLLLSLRCGLIPCTAANVEPSNASCCSLTEKELRAIASSTPPCIQRETEDDIYLRPKLPHKCQNCPVGMCRVGAHCYCADSFLKNMDLKGRCAESFGRPYPASIGREDVMNRSCRPDFVAPPSAGFHSCCTLSEERLEAMRGASALCPPGYGSQTLVQSSCHECPPGTCSVRGLLWDRCMCVHLFLDSSYYQDECPLEFGADWPQTVGAEEKDNRHCSGDYDRVSTTSKSCCNLSRATLDSMRGRNPRCAAKFTNSNLTRSFTNVRSMCAECPPGTCRLGSEVEEGNEYGNPGCVCAEGFLRNVRIQAGCQAAFGAAWPESEKAVEKSEWKDCPNRAEPVLLKNAPQLPLKLENASMEQVDFPSRRADASRPSRLEIAGIVFGVVGLLLIVANLRLFFVLREFRASM